MFVFNCCYDPTSADFLIIEAFDLISPTMQASINRAIAGEKRGKNQDSEWSLVNEIMMFNLQMVIATQDMNEQIVAGTFDITKFEEKYKINCARKFFACKGFDIDPLLNHYGLTEIGRDGLDFIDLEDGDNVWEIG